MMRTLNRTTLIAGCAFLVAFAWFIWPTQYAYDTPRFGPWPTRRDRITNRLQAYYGFKHWETINK